MITAHSARCYTPDRQVRISPRCSDPCNQSHITRDMVRRDSSIRRFQAGPHRSTTRLSGEKIRGDSRVSRTTFGTCPLGLSLADIGSGVSRCCRPARLGAAEMPFDLVEPRRHIVSTGGNAAAPCLGTVCLARIGQEAPTRSASALSVQAAQFVANRRLRLPRPSAQRRGSGSKASATSVRLTIRGIQCASFSEPLLSAAPG